MERTAWSEISALVAAAPYPVEVLPVDPARAAACLAALGITTGSWPPPWTREGKDLSTVSRRPISLAELMSVHEDAARQLAPPESPGSQAGAG